MMDWKLLFVILVAIFDKLLAEPACPYRNDPKLSMRDEATNQLSEFMRNKENINTLTTSSGAPVGDNLNTLTVGPRGPVLLQDSEFLEEMAHFSRERIPERTVHAKAAGAFGYFKVTNDITKYCRAKLFSEVGKVTPIASRLSTVEGERGSADSIREPRGFAVKFYTEDGNWDLLSFNMPIFSGDPILFPGLIHSQKRNPATNLKNPDMFWDFLSLRSESTNLVVRLFSDVGNPYGLRYIDGHGVNTFKMVNENNEAVYCKLHHKSNQGSKCLTDEQSTKMAGSDPDFATRDLYDAIARGDYPSWTMYIQVMTFEQASNYSSSPFDATKIWPEDEFPWIEVGVFTLNENPINYFAQIEQLAFSPSSLVRGIEPSPDKLLQGRLFVYPDAQRYRLGANYLQIPVNKAKVPVRDYKRDGFQTVIYNKDGAPNYYPNSFCGPTSKPSYKAPAFSTSGDVVDRWDSGDEDNFSQAGIFYQTLGDDEKTRLIQNLANNLMNAQVFIQQRAVKNFAQADGDLGKRIQQQLQTLQKMKK